MRRFGKMDIPETRLRLIIYGIVDLRYRFEQQRCSLTFNVVWLKGVLAAPSAQQLLQFLLHYRL